MLQVPSHTFRIAHSYGQNRVSCHPSGESYRELQTYVSHAYSCSHVYSSHTCIAVCNPPTRSLIPLIRSHFQPSWVRLRPFWYHLPLTRRSSTLLVGFYVHICACAHTSIHAPSRGKVLEVTAGESKGEETEGGLRRRVGTTKGWSSLFRNLTCSERKTVKEEVSFRGTSGLGKRLNFYQPPFRHVSPSRALPHPAVPRRVHSLHALNHSVTFLVGTSVPIFRRLLEGKFLLDIILIARVSGRRPSNFFAATRSGGKITHNSL